MPTDFPAPDLPVAALLPALTASLATTPNAVLLAPPGAGKTSLVAPALLGQHWLRGDKILLMLPRRLAARAAAERIAALLGETPGRSVGYHSRLESKPGRRIECLTEGLFVHRLLADPALEGVGALLFDEVHERNLDGDLGLTLALDAQQLLPELRIVAMSATLDGARFCRLLGDAPLFRSEGRSFPLDIRHLGRGPAPLEQRVAAAIRLALAEGEGSVLAFLPGVAEIERTAALLRLPAGVALHRLHGNAAAAAQQAALAPGGRKVVLATSIAETSLTIDGVQVVVDCGLARKPRFDPASGLTRLATVRVSQAAAKQRAGRAGRQGPGLVFRLWDEAETMGLLPFDPPEILAADLAALLLRLLCWGVRRPEQLRWLDPPPGGALAAAGAALGRLGAIDGDGQLTTLGRGMATLPLSPPLARLLLEGAARGQQREAAEIAVVLEERGAGGTDPDLDERLRHFAAARGPAASRHQRLAARWAALAGRWPRRAAAAPLPAALLLASAFPDRLARRRRRPAASDVDAEYLLANGRGARLAASEPLAKSEWLLVADAGGSGAAARIRLAATLGEDALAAFLPGRTSIEERLVAEPPGGWLRRLRIERLGAIEVARTLLAADPQAIGDALLAQVRERGLQILPWPEGEQQLLARLRFAGPGDFSPDDFSDAALLAAAGHWLLPRLRQANRLADVDLRGAMRQLLDRAAERRLERLAPAEFRSPAGTVHRIDYLAAGGPEVEVRAQALFGLVVQPALGDGRVPLTLVLTSPAGRPLARTRDLPGFWKAGWKDVRRDMLGRYPKHPWPDDAAAAAPTVRGKATGRRR